MINENNFMEALKKKNIRALIAGLFKVDSEIKLK